MKAKVTTIVSGCDYKDGERRVRIRFEDAGFGFRDLELKESALGLRSVALDMELDVEVELATSVDAMLAAGDDKW